MKMQFSVLKLSALCCPFPVQTLNSLLGLPKSLLLQPTAVAEEIRAGKQSVVGASAYKK